MLWFDLRSHRTTQWSRHPTSPLTQALQTPSDNILGRKCIMTRKQDPEPANQPLPKRFRLHKACRHKLPTVVEDSRQQERRGVSFSGGPRRTDRSNGSLQSTGSVPMRRVRGDCLTEWPLVQILGHRSLTACASRRFDDEHQVAATKTSRYYPLLIEYGHRRHEYREGCIGHDTSQGSFWHRQRHSHYNQSGFPSAPC